MVINAGSGKDIAITDLAVLVCKDAERIRHVKHHHPQSEIPKLLCDYAKAKMAITIVLSLYAVEKTAIFSFIR